MDRAAATAKSGKVQAPSFDVPPARRAVRRFFSHPVISLSCIIASIGVIRLIEAMAPEAAAVVLIDLGTFSYPYTVQNLMWIIFFTGVGELIVRARDAMAERRQLRIPYLPEDEKTIVQTPELRQIFQTAKQAAGRGSHGEERFLPRLIQRIVLQFQTGRSIDQAISLLNSSLELFLHEIDLRYSMLRYVIWAIPTLGFIGTVIGISLALNYAGHANPQDPDLLAEISKQMAVAFNTTLLALIMSAVLMLAQHLVQAREEGALNKAGQYCLDNLISRLYKE